MTTDRNKYKQWLDQPWGKLQYRIIFSQLQHIENQEVLDFGSGFGLTSQFLSAKNKVTAIEPDEEMLFAESTTHFRKLLGSIEQVEKLADKTFDLIICHNVLEYVVVQDRPHYLSQLERVLKNDGKLSLIKHNPVGKVLQSVLLENEVEKAHQLLQNTSFVSESFSQGQAYSLEELLAISSLSLENYLGIRTFYGLQRNEWKEEAGWLEKMARLELAVADKKPYKDMSFLQHVWLKKLF